MSSPSFIIGLFVLVNLECILTAEQDQLSKDPQLLSDIRDMQSASSEDYGSGTPVPAKNVKFQLYTPDNPENPQNIDVNNVKATSTMFDAKRDYIAFIIHGYIDSATITDRQEAIKDAMLSKYDCNVIVVDWSKAGSFTLYDQAVRQSFQVVGILARFIKTLMDIFGESIVDSIYLIGHSLGAHIAGNAAKLMKMSGYEMHMVIGLDPAGPLFNTQKPYLRISADDAEAVICIHTDGSKFGTMNVWCGVDFFVNGGYYQEPVGCRTCIAKWMGLSRPLFGLGGDMAACSHMIVVEYFMQFSILKDNEPEKYTGRACNSVSALSFNQCSLCKEQCGCFPMTFPFKKASECSNMSQSRPYYITIKLNLLVCGN